jgi:hypothetical protein
MPGEPVVSITGVPAEAGTGDVENGQSYNDDD